MIAPTIYSDWVRCIDTLEGCAHDAEVKNCMLAGTLELTPGVAGRFAKRLSEAVKYRIKSKQDRFMRSMQLSGGDMNALISSMLALRREFVYLSEIARIPALPKEYSDALLTAIQESADSVQANLESQSKSDRSGVLVSVVRNHKVNKLGG